MWRSRLFWKVFLAYAGLTVLQAIAVLALITRQLEPFVVARVEDRLRDTAFVLGAAAQPHLKAKSLDQMQAQIGQLSSATDLRFTVTDERGEVLADSHDDPRRMENHASRPEFRQVLTTGLPGVDRRSSSTTGVATQYVAVPIRDATRMIGVARAASDVRMIDAQVMSLLWLELIVVATSVGATMAITYWIVGRVIRPLSQLTQAIGTLAAQGNTSPVPLAGEDEVRVLGSAFNNMQDELSRRMTEMRDSNARLASIMNTMEEGVLAVDFDERIVLANGASRELLDVGAEEIIGRPLWEVTRQRALRDAFLETFPSGQASVREFETTGAHRRVLTLRATRLPGKPPPGVMMVLRDVTELRRLENLRREFVANVSHELKTPLSSIKAYSETLRLGAINDPEHSATFVQRIEEQAERLHQLIIDLLHLARVESGQQAFDITAVSVSTSVRNCLDGVADRAAAQQVRLVVDPPPDGADVLVRADEEGLRTILSNLVENAIKFTPAGGSVTVRWRRQAGSAVLEIQDTGIGIARQHHARVFERFYRVDKARSRELGGTGLGLSIVKHLTQAFGGSVGLDSQPRQGSTFRVTLPLAAD